MTGRLKHLGEPGVEQPESKIIKFWRNEFNWGGPDNSYLATDVAAKQWDSRYLKNENFVNKDKTIERLLNSSYFYDIQIYNITMHIVSIYQL